MILVLLLVIGQIMGLVVIQVLRNVKSAVYRRILKYHCTLLDGGPFKFGSPPPYLIVLSKSLRVSIAVLKDLTFPTRFALREIRLGITLAIADCRHFFGLDPPQGPSSDLAERLTRKDESFN